MRYRVGKKNINWQTNRIINLFYVILREHSNRRISFLVNQGRLFRCFAALSMTFFSENQP